MWVVWKRTASAISERLEVGLSTQTRPANPRQLGQRSEGWLSPSRRIGVNVRPALTAPSAAPSKRDSSSLFHPTTTAVRAANPASVIADSEYVARRVKRHLNDLERTNYTEPTTGPSAYGEAEDETKGPTALSKDDDSTGVY